jgi:hypothetical protein
VIVSEDLCLLSSADAQRVFRGIAEVAMPLSGRIRSLEE